MGGSLNYLNKNGKTVFSKGVSGNASAQLGPLTVGAGGDIVKRK